VIATAFAAAAVVAVVEASVTLEAQKAFNAMKSDAFTRVRTALLTDGNMAQVDRKIT
jgi:hypothetical protein